MKTGFIVAGGLFGTFVLVTIILIFSAIGIRNGAVTMEKGIKYQAEQNQNTRSKMVNSIAEAAQVPEMYKEDFKEVLTAVVEGTYGEGGSKAVFQWIQERQINYDSTLYTKIQTMIESNRAEFALEQKKLIDKKMLYETKLEVFPSNMILSFFGFPKINLDSFKIVKSLDSEKVFSEGKEAPMKIR